MMEEEMGELWWLWLASRCLEMVLNLRSVVWYIVRTLAPSAIVTFFFFASLLRFLSTRALSRSRLFFFASLSFDFSPLARGGVCSRDEHCGGCAAAAHGFGFCSGLVAWRGG